MAGGLAHEISNPLAIIYARACHLKSQVASGKVLTPEAIDKACDSIIQTSDRAARILKGLRGFGREASEDPIEWASLYNIVEENLDLQTSRYDSHAVKLDVELAPDLPLIYCREVQIGQIITNLPNNAFDAIDQTNSVERWVKLTAAQIGTNVSIRVMDSGPGIEEKFRPHLMDAFFTTKTQGLGMGVGLSLSRAIAVDHGGALELRSDTKNTCFELILPLKPESDRNIALDTNPNPH